jgi:hypothetical protein
LLVLVTSADVAIALASGEPRQIAMTQKTSRPHNSPCADQSKSLADLKESFKAGEIPSPAEITGSWVAVGFFGAAHNHGKEIADVDCAGLRRDGTNTFEEAMLIDGYSVEPHLIGASEVAKLRLTRDNRDGLTFPIDFGGDANPAFRCRLTTRKTLACLIDVYDEGSEFKKMPATPSQLCHATPNDGYCSPR